MSMALNTANLMELTDVTARPILPLKSHDHWGKVSGAWKIKKQTTKKKTTTLVFQDQEVYSGELQASQH